jgi:Fe2+ transport system protein FeoA
MAVESHHNSKLDPAGAKIRLKGKWLEALGFLPGTRVQVIHSKPGEITLKLHPPST